ncbi:MAG: Thioredoxin-related protein [Verrucomicrobiaceae bacterium]|nr:Thioredoxin-related protein [Verrucomicrobiaceae bacterium]
MIKGNQVKLSDSKFVYADVNCDDAPTNKMFSEKFDVKGNTLPFVAIASADGSKLAGHSGYGTAKEFEDLIKEAGKQARKPAVTEKK